MWGVKMAMWEGRCVGEDGYNVGREGGVGICSPKNNFYSSLAKVGG